ncbi:hypothetical protein BH11ARM2_BH11ARM2_33100 [soil metagenome]
MTLIFLILMIKPTTLLIAAGLFLASTISAQTSPKCAHCAMPIAQTSLVTVEVGGKIYPVRCMLCARDLAAQYPGKATVHAPTEDPAQPLILTSDDKGDWTSNLPDVVFLEQEGDHALCNRWSRAFTSSNAFAKYVEENPQYKASKPLALVEWSNREGQAMEHGDMQMDMGMMPMKGFLGPWSMAREGSGTTWLPDESPMFMKTLPKIGRYDLMYMGSFSLNYTDSGGKRGGERFYSNSMPMLMARRDTGGGTLGLRLMGSLDPVFNGKYGAPNLFQTGETAYGNPLKDYQHPHDLLAEAAVTYSKPLKGDTRGFLYLAPIGEPAVGASVFMMRPSGMENPEAPITHHWFDATHISFGVATAGVTFGDKLKLEGSYFNGKEPDEDRYTPDPIRFDSVSGRLTYNPTRNWSFSAAYAHLKESESLEPGVGQHRVTASAMYGKGNLAAALLYGRDVKSGGGASDAYAAELSYYGRDWTTYGRFENVAKDELVNVPPGSYRIDKLTFGTTRDIAHRGGFDFGIGGYLGLYAFPSSLEPFYGKNPVSFGIYLRIRPSRMGSGEMRM